MDCIDSEMATYHNYPHWKVQAFITGEFNRQLIPKFLPTQARVNLDL
jgi:hypothetical protein